MAALAGDLETLWSGRMKLLPWPVGLGITGGLHTVADLIHRMNVNRDFYRELSKTRPVYPVVGWLCFDACGAYAHVE